MKRPPKRKAATKATARANGRKAKPTLGSRIKEARKRRKLTQLGLAHAIGYKGSGAGAFISRVENGEQDPHLGNLQRIARALDVSICSLLP